MLAPFAAFCLLAQPHTSADLNFTIRHLARSHKGYWEATAAYPVFSGSSAVVRLANERLSSAARHSVSGFRKECEDMFREEKTGKPELPYGRDWTVTVSLARPNLISVYFETYEMTGGAHPNHGFATYTFGLVGGVARQLTLKDLFVSGQADGARKVVSDLITPILKERQAGWVDNGDLKEIDAPRAENFVVTPSAITFLFEPYSVGSYAEGNYVVKLPFSTIKGLDFRGPLSGLR